MNGPPLEAWLAIGAVCTIAVLGSLRVVAVELEYRGRVRSRRAEVERLVAKRRRKQEESLALARGENEDAEEKGHAVELAEAA